MKKILCAVIVVVALVACVWADGIPPYAVIDNAASITGGNDAVYVSEGDELMQDGAPVPDITIVSHVRSTLPISRGNVPTRENSLLNPRNPVEITARDDTITISDWGGDSVYSVRLFDAKGELVEVNSEEDSRKYPITVKVSSQPENYYLEFMQKDSDDVDAESDTEFCYVLLSMKAGGPASRDKQITAPPRESRIKRNGNPLDIITDLYKKYRKEAEENPY
ncbi:MAG: hypothetical protein IJP89_05760 [Synergistaceae bacterium]|nr:hypothetical protein [Synergistaceae bacterium]